MDKDGLPDVARQSLADKIEAVNTRFFDFKQLRNELMPSLSALQECATRYLPTRLALDFEHRWPDEGQCEDGLSGPEMTRSAFFSAQSKLDLTTSFSIETFIGDMLMHYDKPAT